MSKIILQAAAISVVVFILATASLMLWRSFHPTSPPNEAHGTQSSEADNHGKEDKSLIDRTAEDPVAFFTLWLTLFTGILAAFTIWMSLSTKDLRDFAEEQARDMKESIAVAKLSADAAKAAVELSDRISGQQLRAYIHPAETITTDIVPTKKPVVRVAIKNIGQTPAYKVRAWMGAHLRPFPFTGTEIERTPDLPIANFVLPPGIPFNLTVVLPQALTEADIGAMSNGTAAIFAVGGIEYEDIFHRAHQTKFRMFIGGRIGIRESGEMGFDEKGNEAD